MPIETFIKATMASAKARSRRRSWPLAIGLTATLFALGFANVAPAQDGMHGHGHDQWHADFYSKLMRPDTKTSCCNLADCRPTEVRASNDHYEVKKDDRWIRVPADKIVRVTAPDGGAHICAPPTEATSWDPDYVYCIVMPMES